VSAKSCENIAAAFDAVVRRAMERPHPVEEKGLSGRVKLEDADEAGGARACRC
jgi:hypothetical protein